MKIIVALMLLAVAPSAEAIDLYCQGKASAAGISESIDHSVVLSLDKEKSRLSLSTFSGPAAGTVKAGPQLYTGFLHSATVTYWINLDRYSGEFALMVYQESAPQYLMEFSGVCKARQPQF